jgi:hypothetical protein
LTQASYDRQPAGKGVSASAAAQSALKVVTNLTWITARKGGEGKLIRPTRMLRLRSSNEAPVMSYKTILVHVDPGPECGRRVKLVSH